MTTTTQPPKGPTLEPSGNRPGFRWSRARLGQDFGLIVVLIVLCVAFAIASPHFLSVTNFTNILQSVAIIGTMASIMTLVLVAGALDLSVGSTAALAGLTSAMLINHGWNPFLAFIGAIVAGLACGLFNGLAVVGARINPIIVTIGTLSLFRGVAFVVSNGHDVSVTDKVSGDLAFNKLLYLPLPVWIMLVIFVITAWVGNRTTAGRAVYAVGANPRAARLSGIPVERTRLLVLVASGMGAAIAGIMLNAQSGAAVPGAADGYELQVLTAVLIGGTSLAGGSGRVAMTLVGVVIIGVINNGMTLLSVPSYYQTIAGGALLLVAVAIDQLRRGTGYR